METDNNNRRLQGLSDSHYEIVEGQADIREWDVRDSQGKMLGEVDELIFDVQARKVRYLVLYLEDNDWGLEERKVLIPIGLAELHEKEDEVILQHVRKEQLNALPTYDDHDEIDSRTEAAIHQVFSGTSSPIAGASSDIDSNALYAHDHFSYKLYRALNDSSTSEDYVRMRQEPSFLEREGTNRREIDDNIDEMNEERMEIEERDAIPVSQSTNLRSGNDVDEWDITDESTPPRTQTDIEQDRRSREERRDRPSGL